MTGLENRDYGHRDPSNWPRGTVYPQKLALTLLTSGGSSVGIVRSRTQATEFRLLARFKYSNYTSKTMTVATGELERMWKEAVIAYFKVLSKTV
jgi:hypothetical protein